MYTLRAFSDIMNLSTYIFEIMNVYVVLETIDLGYHIVSIHFKKEDADQVAVDKNKEYLKLYGSSGKTEWFYVQEETVR